MADTGDQDKMLQVCASALASFHATLQTTYLLGSILERLPSIAVLLLLGVIKSITVALPIVGSQRLLLVLLFMKVLHVARVLLLQLIMPCRNLLLLIDVRHVEVVLLLYLTMRTIPLLLLADVRNVTLVLLLDLTMNSTPQLLEFVVWHVYLVLLLANMEGCTSSTQLQHFCVPSVCFMLLCSTMSCLWCNLSTSTVKRCSWLAQDLLWCSIGHRPVDLLASDRVSTWLCGAELIWHAAKPT